MPLLLLAVQVALFRERRSRRSKGCGFAELGTREQAEHAMEGLDERQVFQVRPMPTTMDGRAAPQALGCRHTIPDP